MTVFSELGTKAQYPHPAEMPNSYEMPFRPRPGQVLFYVEIGRTQDPMQSLKVIEDLGYQPQLRFCSFPSGQKVLCALLLYEQHDPEVLIDENYLSEQHEVLWDRFLPQEDEISVVHFMKGSPKVVAIAA